MVAYKFENTSVIVHQLSPARAPGRSTAPRFAGFLKRGLVEQALIETF